MHSVELSSDPQALSETYTQSYINTTRANEKLWLWKKSFINKYIIQYIIQCIHFKE